MRVPTPHPKKMRAFAKMLLDKKIKNNVNIFLQFYCLLLCMKIIKHKLEIVVNTITSDISLIIIRLKGT